MFGGFGSFVRVLEGFGMVLGGVPAKSFATIIMVSTFLPLPLLALSAL